LSHSQLERLLAAIELPPSDQPEVPITLWVGSIGYENFRDVADFARHLSDAGVERVIDVRELPISRRPGYAKTALGEALRAEGIEYLHVKGLGNPKTLRDLYRSGRVPEGRQRYSRYLLKEQRDELEALCALLEEKCCAVMCVEHDQSVCHRDVIFQALQSEFDLALEVAALG
jgi:uncharacterized protein (DUF488 family)